MDVDATISTGVKLVTPLAMARKAMPPLIAAGQGLSHCPYRHSNWRDMLTKHGQSRHWRLRNTLKQMLKLVWLD